MRSPLVLYQPSLLDSWLDDEEDPAEHQQSWDFLKTALDEDRLSEC